VTEHDHFDGQIRVIGPSQAENLHGPEEGERERNERAADHSRCHIHSGESPRSKYPDEVFGTHRVAAQSVLAIFQILAGNLRKIDNFLETVSTTETAQTSGRRPRRRRRTTEPIDKWLDSFGPAADGGRAPPGE